MWKNFLATLRRWLSKLGLIQQIKSVSSLSDVMMTDDFYNLIEKWQCIYQGYYPEWHDINVVTISGSKKRRMNSLNLGKIVAEEMARLVFNEKVKIHVSPDQFATDVRTVFDQNDFYKLFQDNLEYMFGLGGMVIKVFAVPDPNNEGKYQIKIGFVQAGCFVPLSYSNSVIDEGLFLNQIARGNKWYTHLEWHTWSGNEYVIRNELYESDLSSELGIKVSLATLFPDLPEETRISGLSRPLFVYFKPNIANNFDTQSPLGISIFANALDTIHALDRAFDSLVNEFKLGRKRIIVPATAVKTVVDRQDGTVKRYFDPDDEVYQAFDFETSENQQIIDNSVELRIEEHIAGINALLEILAMQIGFSSGSFTFDGKSVKTATEIISENSKTWRTIASHENLIQVGIEQLITTIGEVAELYDVFTVPDDYEVRIEFDDSIIVDKDANSNYYLKLYHAGLTTKVYTLMQTLGLTEEEAIEMVEARKQEDQTLNPDFEALAQPE